MAINVQKKLEGTDNVLAAFTIDNGIAIGSKKSGAYYVDAVVMLKGNDDGTTSLIINQDKLDLLNGKVIYKDFNDEIPRN